MKKQLLLLGMLATSLASFGQVALNENFEGATFPPAGWTTVDTHATNNWITVTNPQLVIAGNQSAGVNWIAANQDESLVSPSFSLAGYTTAYLNFIAIVGYDYMVAPNDNGDLSAEISTNGGVSWTVLWDEEDEGVYEDYDPRIKNLDISSYVGQTDVKIRFRYVANDADVIVIDDVSVSACPGSGISNLQLTALTDTSATLAITGTSVSYDVEYGPTGFTQGTGITIENATTTANFADLEPGTGYDFYIAGNCSETATSGWEGPYNFYTTLSTPADLDYANGFESVPFTAAGWAVVTPTANTPAWTRFTGDETVPTQEGNFMAGVVGSTTVAADTWLFSRGLNMTAGENITLSYYVKKFILSTAGNGNVNNLTVTVGNDRTAAAQTTTVTALTDVTNTDWVQVTSTFTAPGTGVYYIGFHCTSPAHTTANQGALLLDQVFVDSALGREEILSSELSVFPNPASNVINVANASSSLINGVEVVDINGRTVKTVKFDGVAEAQINISDLASGMYIMNISTDKGVATKKVVKN
jgi:hypothetical protein